MGMKNHELVPEPLVAVIASLKHAEIRKTIMELCRLKVLVFERFGKSKLLFYHKSLKCACVVTLFFFICSHGLSTDSGRL